jgi:hypothetical protein
LNRDDIGVGLPLDRSRYRYDAVVTGAETLNKRGTNSLRGAGHHRYFRFRVCHSTTPSVALDERSAGAREIADVRRLCRQ